MKILPVSSGKGGVGKTTFALNLALSLSRYSKTVLLDLDTGTSSLRHFLDMSIKRDLYHFFKKNSTLDECRASLNKDLDPEGLFSNFSFIASPKNFVHDIVNFSPNNKKKLIDAVNRIDAEYFVIDHKAGLDNDILDFLPVGNTGILLFTPKMKAATITAAELVKASILRIFNLLLNISGRSSYNKSSLDPKEYKVLEEILNRFEGMYQDDKNYDDIIDSIEKKHPKNRVIQILKRYVHNYKVYFVLNQFNDVRESADKIIKPFVNKIYQNVSSKVAIHNLGWILEDALVKKSSEFGIPYIVMKNYQKEKAPPKRDDDETALRKLMGLSVESVESKTVEAKKESTAQNEIERQLDFLKDMYVSDKSNNPEKNIDYIADRIRSIEKSSIHSCGMSKIQQKDEILNRFFNVLRK